jgi:hypothetical protein
MKKSNPKTRTEASAPVATRHLSHGQKQALDTQADAEHEDGNERERLTQKISKLGSHAEGNETDRRSS